MKKIQLQVTDELTVTVIPNPMYEFMMATEDAAAGYGVSPKTVRGHKIANADELIEGTHFLSSTRNTSPRSNSTSYTNNLQSKQIYWTKAGIIRLGFFIKSAKAKQFRNWAEKLILAVGAKAEQHERYNQQLTNSLQPDPRQLSYQARSNRELGMEFEILFLRELIKVEPTKVRAQLSGLVHFYTSQIQ
jgi:hypothetical protein